jgi:hypothetical protein
MSDAIWTAVIGLGGTVIGSVTTVILAKIQASNKARADAAEAAKYGTMILGDLVDIRELRILRALYGEPKGRILEAYRDDYYASSLKAVVNKRWVSQIDKKFHMTPTGADICRTYLDQLKSWKPTG